MSRYISFKQAHEEFTFVAYWYAPMVKTSLELWLQAADELPRNIQHHSTAAATQLVQAALRQAPRPTQEHEPRQLTWLQNHLPGVTTAIEHSLSAQLDISMKRVNVLQSLVKQQPDAGQLRPRIEAEVKTCLLLEISWWVFVLSWPAAALCEGITEASQGRETNRAGSNTPRGHQKRRLQQGSSLISDVGFSIAFSVNMSIDLQESMHALQEALKELGMPQPQGILELRKNMFLLEKMAALASAHWLRLVARLPLGHPDLVDLLYPIDWSLLCLPILSERSKSIIVKPHLIPVLAQPEIWLQIRKWLTVGQLMYLLQACNVDMEHLQDAGLPDAHVKQFMADVEADEEAAPEGIQRHEMLHWSVFCQDAVTGQADNSNGNNADACQSSQNDTAGETGVGTSMDVQGDLDDMQTLLRMMYGSSIQDHS